MSNTIGSSVPQVSMPVAQAKARPLSSGVDSDGDHDGSGPAQAAPAAAAPSATPLAPSGSIGSIINVKA